MISKNKISELSRRLDNNARVQEGEKPSEDPVELMKELDESLTRLEELIVRINKTNNVAKSGDSTLTDLLAKRDCLKKRISVMRDFLDEASVKVSRYSKTEIRIHSTVTVSELQKQIDFYSKELRKTDEQIQELNWLTDLL